MPIHWLWLAFTLKSSSSMVDICLAVCRSLRVLFHHTHTHIHTHTHTHTHTQRLDGVGVFSPLRITMGSLGVISPAKLPSPKHTIINTQDTRTLTLLLPLLSIT